MSIQKEDVYETEDFPVTETTDNEERFEDPDIEKIHVDIDGAMKLFGNRILNADDSCLDFSDSLNRRKRRGYRSGHYVLEIVGTENRDEETVTQKFQRLRFELEELTTEVEKQNTESGKGKVPIINKSDLDSLNDLLKAALLKNELSTDADGALKQEISENANQPTQTTKTLNAVELRDLEQRIKRIEKTVAGNQNKTSHEPLIETIENIRVQVESLNPGYLEGVKNQLESAMSKLAEFNGKRKNYSTDDFEEKINELYKLVTRWDATCANVPSIVKRLHSLCKLHEQAQQFSSRLNELTILKQYLEKKAENHKVMLYELKRESTQVVDELTTKVTKLETRLAALHA